MLTADPILAKDRNETLDPNWEKSSTDKSAETRALPEMDTEEPNFAKFLRERELPSVT